MSADWSQVGQSLERGYLMGRQTGGKLSSLGKIISTVADRLRSERETGQEFQQKVNILGAEAGIKKMFEPTPEWKPTTREEAAEFERIKAGLKEKPTRTELVTQAITDSQNRIRSGQSTATEEWNKLNETYPMEVGGRTDIRDILGRIEKTTPKPKPETPLFPTPKTPSMWNYLLKGGNKLPKPQIKRKYKVTPIE
jgi:hypothetical protein